jgi:hypothetical protein
MTRPAAGVKVFIKEHGPSVSEDWARVGDFARVVACVEGLCTAQPLWLDEGSQRIGYQWLRLRPVIGLRPAVLAAQLRRFGVLLAALHAVDVPAPGLAAYPLASLGLAKPEIALLGARLPCGLFWGDCWHGNVFRGDGAAICVIDPLPNRWVFEPGYRLANGVIDLAMLHMSLFFCHPVARLLAMDPHRYEPPASALLQGYLDAVGAAELAPLVKRVSRTLAIRYIEGYRRRLARPLAELKVWRSHRILRMLDGTLAWEKP